MAWIKIFQTLVNHPKLFKLSELLNKDIHQTCGLLVFLWSWSLDYADDGDLSKYSEKQLYDAVRSNSAVTPNLLQSLKEAGFIDDDLKIHDWYDYAGEFLRGRYSNKYNKNKKSLSVKKVTSEQVSSNSAVTPLKRRVEKSREEYSKVDKKRFIKPTIEQIKEYCKERNNTIDADKFFNYYESNGWRVGRNPMKDWRASVRTWERGNFNQSKGVSVDDNKYANVEVISARNDE